MTKRNRVLLWVLAAAVLALLIALCFVGNTFARYTGTTTETASVQIATWEIALTDGEEEASVMETVEVGPIKPDASKYDATTNNARSNDNFVEAGVLTNTGSVNAKVFLVEDDATSFSVNYYSEDDDGVDTSADERNSTYASTVNDHFDIEVYYSTEKITMSYQSDGDTINVEKMEDIQSSEAGNLKKLSTLEDGDNVIALSVGTPVYIYFDVTWKTDITGVTGDEADAFDTWMAECVKSLAVTIEFNVVQAE